MSWTIEPLEHPQRVFLELTESGWKPMGAELVGVLDRQAVMKDPSGKDWQYWLMRLDEPISEEGQSCSTLALSLRHVGSILRPEKLRAVAVNVSTVIGLEQSNKPSTKFVAIAILKRARKPSRLPFQFPDR